MNYKRLLFLPILFISSLALIASDASDDTEDKQTLIGPPQFLQLKRNDIKMTLGGSLKDDFFFYNNVRTLRNDYSDQNNFVRHKMALDLRTEQGAKRYGTASSEAELKLTNYVYWQQYGHYLPFSKQDIRSTDFDSVIVARDVTVKTLMPLIFVEQAWFKLNLDTFMKTFDKHPASFQLGFFKYFVGRGVSLGYHDDLAVDYLGWPGEGGYTRYPHMPPGALFRVALSENWTADLYWMKWSSVSTDLEDTLAPSRSQRLDAGPGRGVNKDRSNYVLKFDYMPEDSPLGDLHLQPYLVHTRAPEQSIEFEADASSNLTTLGAMVDCTHGNFNVNIEVAGQFGNQNIYPIDRNVKVLSGGTPTFSHIVYDGIPAGTAGDIHVPVRSIAVTTSGHNAPESQLEYIVNLPSNRNVNANGSQLKNAQGANLTINKSTGLEGGAGSTKIYNADAFGNARFRPGYKLDYQGFMALADVSYTFDDLPYKLTSAAGYISGDNYPYNDETSRTYRGFVPMRSRYSGQSMENFLVFDRMVIPRPLNISHRTLWAYNNVKDLSNLQFLGIGLTWYPLNNRKKCFCSTNIWGLWEVAQLKAWDQYGSHPDAATEKQIALERARLGFPGAPRTYAGTATPGNCGWTSTKDASRMLGVELDLRATYNFLDHASGYALFSLFMPGKLYRDLEGQPNFTTRRVDNQGLSHYDSLGSEPAFAAVVGLNYKF